MLGHRDKGLLNDTLFIKDGPLSLRGQYSKLVPRVRSFLQFARDRNRPVPTIGQEKTGTFADHLASIVRFGAPHERGAKPSFAALSHEYVRREVYRLQTSRTPTDADELGREGLLKLDPGTYMVLNVPTGHYNPDPKFPGESNLIGLGRILATIPSLVSHKFEGLFPIELANGISSMSSYPSAKILERFLEGR